MTVNVELELYAKDAVRGVRRGDVIVVIDVLRCSSTIITSLDNGASSVIPTKSLKEAIALHKEHPEYLLAGERRGLKPKGFDLGNSPLEFTQGRVLGKSIILTTTSGTKALVTSKGASWVLIGAFLNAKSVAETTLKIAKEEGRGISIVSSGREGFFSLEDFICSGAIVGNIHEEEVKLSDTAVAAYLTFSEAHNRLLETIQKGEHAKYLIRIGLKGDVEFCCKLDHLSVVPVYKDGLVTLLR